jgi:hypothetical protein
MTRQLRSALGLVILFSHNSIAQVRVLSAPPEPSLLNITRQWSRASPLGDLRELRTGGGDLELRVWGGYGLTTGTQAVVLRRAGGQWSAFLARVVRCEIQIPRSVGDTASRATMQRYVAEARQHCGTTITDLGAGAQVITTDTVVAQRLSVPDSLIENAWSAAVRAGVFKLPGRVERSPMTDDVFMYVVEVRNGADYRASVIEHLERGETEADQQVKAVYAAVSRLLTPEQQLKP